MAYFNTKQVKTIPQPIPDTPGYIPPTPPIPPTPGSGSDPYITPTSYSGDGNITLYINKDDNNVINKNPTQHSIYNIAIKEDVDIMNPVIILKAANILHCNYAYIDLFGRYYYIKSIDTLPGGLVKLNMHIDVLKTYSSDILNCEGVISRQENNYNLYLPDNEFKVYANNNKKTIPFNKTPFNKDLNFILCVNGGI